MCNTVKVSINPTYGTIYLNSKSTPIIVKSAIFDYSISIHKMMHHAFNYQIQLEWEKQNPQSTGGVAM